jgi:hypothetical protein
MGAADDSPMSAAPHRPVANRLIYGSSAWEIVRRRRSGGGAEVDSAAAVRDFISDGVIDHDGYEACSYLVPTQPVPRPGLRTALLNAASGVPERARVLGLG